MDGLTPEEEVAYIKENAHWMDGDDVARRIEELLSENPHGWTGDQFARFSLMLLSILLRNLSPGPRGRSPD